MIQVFPDPEALSRGAAEFFVSTARAAVAARGRFSVALSGGSTPRRTYELLAQPAFRDRLPWAQSHVFWGDERCVDPEDPRSNARLAREALLDHVPLPAGQVYPMLCHPTPAAGARSYEALLRNSSGPVSPVSTSSSWVWEKTAIPPPCFPATRCSASRSAGWRQSMSPSRICTA